MEYSYITNVDASQFFVGVGICVLLVIGAFALYKALMPTLSLRYRKYLTNLYVSGRIRQFAEKDKIDLTKEEKEFLEYEKMSIKERIRDLDDKIENELKKKVEENINIKEGKK